MTIPAYPLAWPEGWKRTRSFDRRNASFRSNKNKLSVAAGVMRVRDELKRMGIGDDDLVVSTNIPLRLDGFPRSDTSEPTDRGVAVYWRTKRQGTRCMAIDLYSRVADNLAAIAATLEALRAIERHGGAEILDRAFTGFAALPPADAPWYAVLGVDAQAPTDVVRSAYLKARSTQHPDRGGDAATFDTIQRAWIAFCTARNLSP